MFENFFADPKTLLLGAVTGILFGFLLQKGGVNPVQRYSRSVSFKGFHSVKNHVHRNLSGWNRYLWHASYRMGSAASH